MRTEPLHVGFVAQEVSSSTHALMRCAEARGHSTVVFDPVHCALATVNGRIEVRSKDGAVSVPDVVCTRLTGAAPDWTHGIVRHLEASGVPCANSAAVIERVHDKARVYPELHRAGIPIPRTVLIPADVASHDRRFEQLTDAIGGPPWVLRFPKGRHGAGVMVVDSTMSLRSVVDAFQAIDQPLLLQEFIAVDGVAYRALTVGGECVAAARRRSAPDDFRSNLSQGGSFDALGITGELRIVAERTARLFGMAFAGIDLVVGPDGPIVLEPNNAPGLMNLGIDPDQVANRMIDHLEHLADRRVDVG